MVAALLRGAEQLLALFEGEACPRIDEGEDAEVKEDLHNVRPSTGQRGRMHSRHLAESCKHFGGDFQCGGVALGVKRQLPVQRAAGIVPTRRVMLMKLCQRTFELATQRCRQSLPRRDGEGEDGFPSAGGEEKGGEGERFAKNPFQRAASVENAVTGELFRPRPGIANRPAREALKPGDLWTARGR